MQMQNNWSDYYKTTQSMPPRALLAGAWYVKS